MSILRKYILKVHVVGTIKICLLAALVTEVLRLFLSSKVNPVMRRRGLRVGCVNCQVRTRRDREFVAQWKQKKCKPLRESVVRNFEWSALQCQFFYLRNFATLFKTFFMTYSDQQHFFENKYCIVVAYFCKYLQWI